jgi:hypothetical protein
MELLTVRERRRRINRIFTELLRRGLQPHILPLFADAEFKGVPMSRELVGHDDIAKLFSYQPPTPEMQPRFEAVARACEAACRVIEKNVPASADRTLAIQHLIDARMRANMAIALDGARLIPMGGGPTSGEAGA